MYSNETAFWEDFFIINKNFKQSKCIKCVEILSKSQLKCQTINAEDVAKAKAEY